MHRRGAEDAEVRIFDKHYSELCELCTTIVDNLHGFVSSGETIAGSIQYEIAVADWQGRDFVHYLESENGRKELIGS